MKLKYNKNINIIFISIFLFMWILFGLNNGNADYLNYKNVYDFIGENGWYYNIEPGYALVCKISNTLGLNYNSFLIAYSFIGLFLIANTILKYSNKINFVFILYFIYPFLLDIVQIRNFMAMAIFIFSIRYLVDKSKYSYLKYIILILIASLFHNSVIFYLIFILARINNNKLIVKISIAATFISIIFQPFMQNIVDSIFSNKSYSIYFTQGTSIYGKFLFIIYFALNFVLVYFANKNILSSLKLNKISNNKTRFSEVLYRINIISLIIYSFVIIDVDFFRLYRNILPLNYILFSMMEYRRQQKQNELNMLHRVSSVYFVLILSYAFIFWQTYNTVVLPIFTQNSLIKIFK